MHLKFNCVQMISFQLVSSALGTLSVCTVKIRQDMSSVTKLSAYSVQPTLPCRPDVFIFKASNGMC